MNFRDCSNSEFTGQIVLPGFSHLTEYTSKELSLGTQLLPKVNKQHDSYSNSNKELFWMHYSIYLSLSLCVCLSYSFNLAVFIIHTLIVLSLSSSLFPSLPPSLLSFFSFFLSFFYLSFFLSLFSSEYHFKLKTTKVPFTLIINLYICKLLLQMSFENEETASPRLIFCSSVLESHS